MFAFCLNLSRYVIFTDVNWGLSESDDKLELELSIVPKFAFLNSDF